MVRASAAVASYECGSVWGLVMIEVSVTLVPPSCAAIEPQKFSAATTVILPPEAADDALPGAVVAQADAVSATAPAAVRTAKIRLRGCGMAACDTSNAPKG